MVHFLQHEEFTHEFKKLAKKRKTLAKDFELFCKVLKMDPRQHIAINWLWESVEWKFYKVKKFVCRSIAKNSKNSWIRIIYRYMEDTETIEFSEITFIEIYHKNQKENHDSQRIKKNFWKDGL